MIVIFFWTLVILHCKQRYVTTYIVYFQCHLKINIFFVLQEGHHDNQGQNLYSRFCISGRDIAAFFTDGSSHIGTCDLESPSHSSQLSAYPARHTYSLVDRCGIVVIVNQVQLPQSH